MEMTSGPWTRALEEIDKWTAVLTGTLTGSDVLAGGLAAALPILVAIASRNLFGLVATALLVVLALLLARGGESSLALALYFVSVIMALQGFAEARRYRTVQTLRHEIEGIHQEMSGFLTALDRRTQAIDETRLRTKEAKPEREAS